MFSSTGEVVCQIQKRYHLGDLDYNFMLSGPRGKKLQFKGNNVSNESRRYHFHQVDGMGTLE